MGEKFAPATPADLPRLELRSEEIECNLSPILAQGSDSSAHSSPTNGQGAAPDAVAQVITPQIVVPQIVVPQIIEKAYYEQILENAPEAISITDPDLNITRINAEFTR